MTQFKLKADLIELASYEEKVEFIQERIVVNFNGWANTILSELVVRIKDEVGIDITFQQLNDDVLTDKVMDKIIVNLVEK